MSWLHEQFSAWQEILAGTTFLLLGLVLEFAIDVWRERVLKKRVPRDREGYILAKDRDANQRHGA